MLDPDRFVDALAAERCHVYTGVPCSHLTPLIATAIARSDTDYLSASSEGDALAIAAGHWLGGRRAVVLCQNSGLGNMLNPLTSLNEPLGLPVLIIMTWRGKPGIIDEPQHELMGRITPGILDLLGITWAMLPTDDEQAARAIGQAVRSMEASRTPVVLLMPGDCFQEASVDIGENAMTGFHRPTRVAVLAALADQIPESWPIIATTGKTARELFTLGDRPNQLYCVGSMGYANALAHGLALATDGRVVVLDGDGAAIMHLGNITSIGAAKPRGLVHILLDNQVYDSTGAQPTMSASIDFPGLARAAGYRAACHCTTVDQVVCTLQSLPEDGPILIHVAIASGSLADLARPTIKPRDVAARLRGHVGRTSRSTIDQIEGAKG